MTRLLALLASIMVLLAAAPTAEAKRRLRHSDVMACAALVGAPCQAYLNTPRAFNRAVILKETQTWHWR